MISTPFSAWILRIENMRSCLRIVDAPSTPLSSAIATRSAGVFFLSSFKCILRSFLGELCSSSSKVDQSRRAAGRRVWEADRQFKETGRSRSRIEVCRAGPAVNQPLQSAAPNRLKGPDDHQHDNDRRGDARDFVDHPDGLVRQRPLSARELLAIGGEPALVGAQQNDEEEL